jgi:short-subunit dehydrogenase
MRIEPGSRVLLTGASRGIGRALAEALAARGAVVGLVARDEGALSALAAELPGSDHSVLACDVGDAAATKAAVDRFAAGTGGIDLAIANAGLARTGPFTQVPVEDVEEMTRVNWLGTVYTLHAALPHMLDQARGHVVVVSSGAAWRTFPWTGAYGATKGAQRLFAEALRHELSGTGVSLTTVFPGEIATTIHDHEPEAMPDWYRGGSEAESPDVLVGKIIDAVEQDRRAVYHPASLRVLGALHGISPRLADRVLRAMRGRSAAPRLD